LPGNSVGVSVFESMPNGFIIFFSVDK
jgi:hypothetical protein